tara:strand:- start:5362 stop:6498 length:1137 start_codon:yes stop_codon:yes gene_type:complete
MDNSLVWWTGDFNSLIKDWVINNRPDLLDSLNNSILLEKEMWVEIGHNAYRFAVLTGLMDRKHETQFMYNTKFDHEWIPYEEHPKQSFTDCMFDAAKSVADEGKTIDLFWSGGLDSNAMLIAFNELGLHKQLRVIMGGSPESPELFDKLIKGRIDYVFADPNTQTETYSLAKPDEHVFTAGIEADFMFGGTNLFSIDIDIKDYMRSWNFKRRYNWSNRLFRMIGNCNLNWVDIRNHKSFFTHPSIEKFVVNYTLSGEMVFYNLADSGWDNSGQPGLAQWLRTVGLGDKHSKNQKHYLTCKMPIRDFVYNFTKDKTISYDAPKVISIFRMKFDKSSDPSVTHIKKLMPESRNIAITGEGVVITRDNFSDYDWSEYIPDL